MPKLNKSRMFDGGKRFMKRALEMPQNQKLSDDDFHAYQFFIISTISGSDWETKCWHQDYIAFRNMLRLSYKNDMGAYGGIWYSHLWLNLKWKFDQDGMWPVFEKRGETCAIAFFQDGVRRTDWHEFKHPSDYPGGAAAWAAAPAVDGGTNMDVPEIHAITN